MQTTPILVKQHLTEQLTQLAVKVIEMVHNNALIPENKRQYCFSPPLKLEVHVRYWTTVVKQHLTEPLTQLPWL